MCDEKITGRLESWYRWRSMIIGAIYDDTRERFEDGQSIHTSSINGDGDNLKEGDVVQTKNSRYLLGKRGHPIMEE